MKTFDILDNINTNYKNKKKKLDKIINTNKKYTIKFDSKHHDLLYLKSNNTISYSAKYNLYGGIKDNTWMWANMIEGVNNHVIKKLHKLRENKEIFNNKNDSSFYYKLLSNNTLELKSTKDIKLIQKLLMYLNNDIVILNPINKEEFMTFIGITKIIENYESN